MSQVTEDVVQINTRNYHSQCKHIKKKLLSVDTCDTSYITFFKKLHVILHKLPAYFTEFEDKIDEQGQRWINFWDELHGDSYFVDFNGLTRIN